MSYLTFPHLGLFLCCKEESRSSHLPRAERFIPQLPDGVWASDGSQVISPPSSTLGRRKLPPPGFSSFPGAHTGKPRPTSGKRCRAAQYKSSFKNLSAPRSFSLPVTDTLGVLSVLNESPWAHLRTTDCFSRIPPFHPTDNLKKMSLPPPLSLFPFFPVKAKRHRASPDP